MASLRVSPAFSFDTLKKRCYHPQALSGGDIVAKNNAYRGVVGTQAAIAISGAALAYFIGNPHAAISVLWGGFAALANGMLLLWRMRCGKNAGHDEPRRHLRSMYRSSLERFFVVIALLALGMGWLRLAPLAVLAGFVAGMVASVAAQLLNSSSSENV